MNIPDEMDLSYWMTAESEVLPSSFHVAKPAVKKPSDYRLMLTLKFLVAASLFSTMAGTGIVIANMDGTTTGILVAAIGTMITAVVGGIVAVIQARSKSRQEEMRLQLEQMKMQLDYQKDLSKLNNQSLNSLHSALSQNTLETMKGVQATDQMKQRVEQLSDKMPVTPTSKIE